jgi:predicted dehydrogenase
VDHSVRWGILGTANIGRRLFLPGLRAAGGGIAYAVAGRDMERTRRYATENGIERAIEGYETLLLDDSVDAVYIALPNSLHAEWTMQALRAGKAVLCEKPLCTSVAETRDVLREAEETGSLLWEAFVFPFQEQMRRVQELLAGGAIGALREIQSNFHFRVRGAANIRLSGELAGGGLNDVGCYCVRLSNLFFDGTAEKGVAMAAWSPEGVDMEMSGVLLYGEDRRLAFSCGLSGPIESDTFSRLLGTEGEIRLTSPFHPGPDDTIEIRGVEQVTVEPSGQSEPSFATALRRINAAVKGQEAPQHLAISEALPTAIGLELARNSARQLTPQ